MRRPLAYSLVALPLVASAAFPQDGPLRRTGRALDNAGKNIRNRVETEVARGQVTAEERDVLHRVSRRVEWDKPLAGPALRLEARPGGVVVLRGSVLSDAAGRRAADLAENTTGVTGVDDELAVVKEVKVIESRPTVRIIGVEPGATKVVVPPATEVIVKP